MTIILERGPRTDDWVDTFSSMGIPAADRILRRIDINEPGCWIWPGSRTVNGYGTVQKDAPARGVLLTHRVLYEYFIGEIPEGLQIDHLCRVRLCCNPVHMEPVTPGVNTRRGEKYRPAVCARGHEYTPENMLFSNKGYLRCRECNRIRCRARKERLRDDHVGSRTSN